MIIFHHYSKPGTPNRVSVAAIHSDGLLKIAVSRCSKRDQFVRAKGRAIAEGRLLKGRYYKTIPMVTCDGKIFLANAIPLVEDIVKKGINCGEEKSEGFVDKAKRTLMRVISNFTTIKPTA